MAISSDTLALSPTGTLAGVKAPTGLLAYERDGSRLAVSRERLMLTHMPSEMERWATVVLPPMVTEAFVAMGGLPTKTFSPGPDTPSGTSRPACSTQRAIVPRHDATWTFRAQSGEARPRAAPGPPSRLRAIVTR